MASGLFDTFLGYFNNKIDNISNTPKFISLSAHDSTIIQLLTNLLNRDYIRTMALASYSSESAFHFLIPPFASSFIIELHQVDTDVNQQFRINKNSRHNLKQEREADNKFSDEIIVGTYYVKIFYNGEEISENLHQDLKYNKSLSGIEYSSFKTYLLSRIDSDFKTLYCNINNEIDYTAVGEVAQLFNSNIN